MNSITKVLLISITLVVSACAKSTPPIEQPLPPFPVVLVNAPKTTIINVEKEPSTKRLVKISKNDRADEALEVVLDYVSDLKAYSTAATSALSQCRIELTDRDERLAKIRQYIILSQPSTQPVY